jgi:hypothetical protein
LHYQPEASTTPLGDVYDDQILMIKNLSYSLPLGWKIYVKENIIQWKWPKAYLGRYYDYYQQLADINNVKLIPPSMSTFDLIEKSQAVAVVTGTAGFEAVLRSKSVLLFGYTWFMDCEGVFQVRSIRECCEALSLIDKGYTVDNEKVCCFLGAIDRVGVAGYAHKRFQVSDDVSYKENINNIVKNIFKILNQENE